MMEARMTKISQQSIALNVQIMYFNRFCEMNRWITKILGTIFLICIFSTESLNQNGIFLLFLYSFKTESKTINRIKIKIPKIKIKISTPHNVYIPKCQVCYKRKIGY